MHKVSGNLETDLLTLASSLRERGCAAEANELEDKYFHLRLAETQLYRIFDETGEDVVNQAHPDGDYGEGLGAVETQLSIHQQMLDVARKPPTGKYSAVVEAVEKILKEAQLSPISTEDSEGKKSPEQIVSNQDEEIAKSTLSPDTLEKMEAANKIIQEAWSRLPGSLSQAVSSFPAVEFTEAALLQGNGVDKYCELLKNPGLKPILTQLKKTKEAFGDNISSPKGILSVLSTKVKNPSEAYSFVASYAPWLANHRFKGAGWHSTPNEKFDEPMYKTENDLSVYMVNWETGQSGISSANLAEAARETYEFEYVKKRDQVFGDNLAAASAAATEEAQKYLKPLVDEANSRYFSKKDSFLVTASNPTTGIASGVLFDFQVFLAKKLKEIVQPLIDLYNASGQATSILGATGFSQIRAVFEEAKAYTIKVSSISIDKNLDIPQPSALAGIKSRFAQAITKLQKFKKENSGKLKEKQLAIIDNNSKILAGAVNALRKDVVNKPYAYVLEILKAEAPTIAADAPTPDALANLAEKAVKIAWNVAGEKEEDIPPPLVKSQSYSPRQKLGQNGGLMGGDDKPVAKSPSVPKAPAGGNAPAAAPVSSGLGRFAPSSPDQVAVANMQLALNTFGAKIANGENKSKFPKVTDYSTADGLKIIGTGPKSNPQLNMFDGKWGTNTNNALTTAQKYLQGLGLTLTLGVQWDPASRTHAADTVKKAEANTAILGKANSYLEGGKALTSTSDAQTLDILGQPLAFEEVQPNWGNIQNIKIFKSDLASFASLYDFLVKNNLRQPEYGSITIESESSEGFSFQSWNKILNWFPERAKFLFEASKAAAEADPGTQKSTLAGARVYYQAATRLQQAFQKMVNLLESQAGTKGKYKPSSVVDWSLLNKFIPPTSGGTGGSGRLSDLVNPAGTGAGSSYTGTKKSPGESITDSGKEDLEGHRVPKAPNFEGAVSDDEPPIREYINFNHPRWSDFDSSQLSSPGIYLEDLRMPGKRMAQNLFSGKIDMKEAEKKAVESLGYNPAGYSDQEGVLIYRGPGNATVPASRVLSSSDIRERTNLILQRAPITRYKKFLMALSGSLHDVLRSWINDHQASPSEFREIQKWQNEWQRLITKQLDDLSR